LFAVQHLTDHSAAPFNGNHPGSLNPRRIVAHMLVVAAGELGDPIAFVVLVKAYDRLFQGGKPQTREFQR
jgi:hypothetical protein